MKTLVLTENFPPISGGSGRWFWELYSRLPQSEFYIVADNSEQAVKFDKEHELSVQRVPLKCEEWGVRSFKGFTFYLRTIWKLRKIIKRHNITHLHAGRVIHEGVSAWLLKLFCGVKYLCYVHGEDVETAATSGEHNLLVKQVCKHAELLICNSQNSAEIVQKLGYADSGKIQVLNPGVNSKTFFPKEENADFKKRMGWTGKKVILTVGRLQQRKGQDMMIKAMPTIIEKHPDSLYIIIGSGDRRDELEKLVNEQNLHQHVKIIGEISDEDMIACYQQCDLFILPNRTIDNDIEGFGMVLVEAQSCGKTVIAGDSGGTKETMLVNETGFIIDCTDSRNISSIITKLLSEPKRLEDMGKLGRLHVERNLDWSAHVEKAKIIFSSLN